jgi:hypothetical protein
MSVSPASAASPTSPTSPTSHAPSTRGRFGDGAASSAAPAPPAAAAAPLAPPPARFAASCSFRRCAADLLLSLPAGAAAGAGAPPAAGAPPVCSGARAAAGPPPPGAGRPEKLRAGLAIDLAATMPPAASSFWTKAAEGAASEAKNLPVRVLGFRCWVWGGGGGGVVRVAALVRERVVGKRSGKVQCTPAACSCCAVQPSPQRRPPLLRNAPLERRRGPMLGRARLLLRAPLVAHALALALQQAHALAKDGILKLADLGAG